MQRQQLIDLARTLRYEGAGTEDILTALHAQDCSSWEAVVVIRMALELSLPTAKMLVFRSPLWQTPEQRAAAEEIATIDQRHAALQRLMQQLAKGPDEEED